MADQRVDPNKAADHFKPLLQAALCGYTEIVKALLADKRIKTEENLENGASPLLLTAQNGHTEVVKMLLDDPRVQANIAKGYHTPLIVAVQNGHVKTVETLLRSEKVDTSLTLQNGCTALLIAALNRHEDVVQTLLADHRIDPGAAQKTGETALYMAAGKGQTETVKELLKDPRVTINLAMEDGATPFFIAVQNGHTEIVKTLISNSEVDPLQTLNDGSTPLNTAILFGHLEVAKILLSHPSMKNSNSELRHAAEGSYDKLVKVLLDDKDRRAYFLKQIIAKPNLMKKALLNNKVFLKALRTHREELSTEIGNYKELGITVIEHANLLKQISEYKDSHFPELHHPLCLVFSEPTITRDELRWIIEEYSSKSLHGFLLNVFSSEKFATHYSQTLVALQELERDFTKDTISYTDIQKAIENNPQNIKRRLQILKNGDPANIKSGTDKVLQSLHEALYRK